MIWLGSVIILFILVVLGLYWQLIIAEGAYLGQRVVTLLYDLTAHKYNQIKDNNPVDENYYLGIPLSQSLGYNFKGVLLDVATGTGRLPVAMKQDPHFKGQIIGLDHSIKMLMIARETMPDLPLILGDAMHLPFAQSSVQAITCLESLEFFPSPLTGLNELVRVLTPNGNLLTTNRIGWEARLMPGKAWKLNQLQAVLRKMPLTEIRIIPWLDIYDQVWAKKKCPPKMGKA